MFCIWVTNQGTFDYFLACRHTLMHVCYGKICGLVPLCYCKMVRIEDSCDIDEGPFVV